MDVLRVTLSGGHLTNTGVEYDMHLGDICIGRAKDCVYAAARCLLSRGYPPDAKMTTRWRGKGYDNWIPQPIGSLAKWTVSESGARGLRRVPYRAFHER